MPSIRRTALVLAAALAALAPPASHAAQPVRPDLVSKAPNDRALEIDAASARLLLRFDGFVRNAGRGPVELRAANQSAGTMSSVKQRIWAPDYSSFADSGSAAVVRYEDNDQHEHFHFQQAARYSLWDGARQNRVVTSPKVGFCLEDADHVDPYGPDKPLYKVGHHPDYDFCGNGDPTSPSILMGLSAGWEDVYGYDLAFQWLDVSNVAPGRYRLAAETDPQQVILESDELNPIAFASDESIVPGWRARPVDAGTVPGDKSTPIELDAARYGNPGPPKFKIVDPPDHGSLDVPTGKWLSDPAVKYTPSQWYSGPDSFRYVARDATSPYPTSPPAASASLSVKSAPSAVAISGAPGELETGRGVQLSASVTNGPPQVKWSADKGTITASGFYTAPASAPAGGSVHIRATAATGAYDDEPIRIVAPPAPKPALSVPTEPAKPTPKRSPLSKLRIVRRGHLLLVKVSASRPGRIDVGVRKRKHKIGGCRVRAPARRHIVCRVRLRSKVARATGLYCTLARAGRVGRRRLGLRVTVALRIGKRVVAVRRARV